jgi:hypothetical protein
VDKIIAQSREAKKLIKYLKKKALINNRENQVIDNIGFNGYFQRIRQLANMSIPIIRLNRTANGLRPVFLCACPMSLLGSTQKTINTASGRDFTYYTSDVKYVKSACFSVTLIALIMSESNFLFRTK